MFKIIPAIDIINGKCVRLTEGDFSKKTEYKVSPLETAQEFKIARLTNLHIVDLEASKGNNVSTLDILYDIVVKTGVKINYSGGLRTENDVAKAFEFGASTVSIGTMAMKNRKKFLEILDKFGPEKVILSADFRNEKISINGWTENTDTDLYSFIRQNINSGITQTICTDISRDGTLGTPSTQVYKKILEKFSGLKLIASGGVSSVENIQELKAIGCDGVIIGKAIYEGNILLSELKQIEDAS